MKPKSIKDTLKQEIGRVVQQSRRHYRRVQKLAAPIALCLACAAFVSAWIGVANRPLSDNDTQATQTFWDSLTDSLYEAAQVLLLNMSPHDGKEFGFFIGVARVSSVLLVTLIAIQAIGKLFRESFDHLRILVRTRVLRERPCLVCGLGRIGHEIALQNSPDNLVVVHDLAQANPLTPSAMDAGATVFEGDATIADSLRDQIFCEPSVIHLVTGSDISNINALVNVKKLRAELSLRNGSKPLKECECYVHIDDAGLHRTLLRCLIEANCKIDPSLRIRPFNIYNETACRLIIDKLTALRPRKSQVALYVIFGLGQMGLAMLKSLVEFAHFENQKRSRILVLLPTESGGGLETAEQAYQQCISRWSRLTPRLVFSDITRVKFDADLDEWSCQKARPETATQSVAKPNEVEYAANVAFCPIRSSHSISHEEAVALARLAGALESNSDKDNRVKASVLFCLDEDDRNFRMANELNDCWQDTEGINIHRDYDSMDSNKLQRYRRKTSFQIPIFAFMPRSGPLRRILEESADSSIVRPFGAVQEGIDRAHDRLVDNVAMEIAWSYDAESKREEARGEWCKVHNVDRNSMKTEDIPIRSDQKLGIIPKEDYLPVWNAKPFWEHISNRNAAEHARILMQTRGYAIAGADERGSGKIDFDAIDEQDRQLMAAIEHNRWIAERLLMDWTLGDRMDQPQQRPSMVPTENLPPDELAKDLNQVRIVLKCLENNGIVFRSV